MKKNDHYFSSDPKSEVILHNIEYSIGAERLVFTSSSGVFSKMDIDQGSDALIHAISTYKDSARRLLDMGCGYGVIGIALSRLLNCEAVMCDINPRAVELAQKNIKANSVQATAFISNGFEKVEGLFDLIVTNPPIRAGKDVFYSWFQKAPEHLEPGGSLWCVIRKKQGAPSAKKKLEEIFGNCQIAGRDKGYYILMSIKES